VDICIFGTEVIAPLLTTELLQFPLFCLKFYAMVTFTAEAYPEKMATVSDRLMAPIMSAINLGLTAFGAEVCSHCCDFIGSMATHLSTYPQLANTPFANYMHDFLKVSYSLSAPPKKMRFKFYSFNIYPIQSSKSEKKSSHIFVLDKNKC